jgi:hypothetical protein
MILRFATDLWRSKNAEARIIRRVKAGPAETATAADSAGARFQARAVGGARAAPESTPSCPFRAIAPWGTKASCLLGVLTSALALAASAGAVQAQIPLTDGVDGMTCHFYAKAGRLRWDRPGGDWLDAAGDAHGGKPFSIERVVRRGGVQDVTLDLTDLARAWSGSANGGTVLLRTVDSGKNDIVRFLSSEHKDSSLHPKLVIEWDDGKREMLDARADTYFACPTHKSLGRSNNFRVGGDRAVILVFPWTARPAATWQARRSRSRPTSNMDAVQT